MKIRPLSMDDAAAMVAHAAKVGWEVPLAYVQQILKNSLQYAFAADDGGQIAATALATPYENRRAWVGMVITHPDYQQQGLARRLMQRLIQQLQADGIGQIMLDASSAGQPLYEKLGFRPLHKTYRLRRPAELPAPPLPPTVQPATDLDLVRALDAAAFGVSRPHFYPHFGVCYQHSDGQGFIMVQNWRENAPSLGAWVHAKPEGAAELFQAMLHLYRGQSIGVTAANDAARVILAPYGFEVVGQCSRMLLGEEEPRIQKERYFGAVSMAVG